MLETFPQDVKIVFKNFPLPQHEFAGKAAIAALAAEKQGMFWEFHDLLFFNLNQLNDQVIEKIAQELNLDMEAFQESLEEPKASARISRDMLIGTEAGVDGVPSVFVNGRLVKNHTLQAIKAFVAKELATLNADGS